MLSTILSATTLGLDGVLIKVEVDVAGRGFPTFTIVGLPNKAIEEAKERVRTAIYNASFDMPDSRVVVNMAPADIPKEGSIFDLPIAIGILASQDLINSDFLSKSIFVGELSLNGKIRPVPGILPITILAKKLGIENIFIPKKNAAEAALIRGVSSYSAGDLAELVMHLNEAKKIDPNPPSSLSDYASECKYQYGFEDVKGQENAKRALEIAAAGFHNLHLTGPPGAGKTMLARCFPSILPNLTQEEMIEVAKISSITTGSKKRRFSIVRPFRCPHHTTSRVGLVGGGQKLNPGEISLAHRGVLFLDEFPEFPRSVLEALRQPLEDGFVSVSRARGTITFPSRFMLISASNPCMCGFLGHPTRNCTCSSYQINKYRKRVSGPIMDRIDLHVQVPAVEISKLAGHKMGQTSEQIKKRVIGAQKIQQKRFDKSKHHTNGEMSSSEVEKYCIMTDQATQILYKSATTLSLSARSYFKIKKISRTIADLGQSEVIGEAHVLEALQYRFSDN